MHGVSRDQVPNSLCQKPQPWHSELSILGSKMTAKYGPENMLN